MPFELGSRQKAYIADLRTPGRQQGRFYLTRWYGTGIEHDCALGIACKLSDCRTSTPGPPLIGHPGDFVIRYEGREITMPPSVVRFFGFRSGLGSPKSKSLRSISGMNDGGMSFAQIAEVIETHACEYFIEPR